MVGGRSPQHEDERIAAFERLRTTGLRLCEQKSSDPLTQSKGEEAGVTGSDCRIQFEMREAFQVELHDLKGCRFQNLPKGGG